MPPSKLSMKYQPNYAKGEILVEFKGPQSKDFAKAFGEKLGYALKDEEYKHGNAFIYIVPEGQEKKISRQFERYKKFVDWADRRDIRLEQRWTGLEKIISKLEALKDNAEIPDREYKRLLDNISTEILKLR